eukprot:gnl/TRDRNA2_/TRDRNA2_171010_c0_seq2.p1 gnl/TRDRNA2_/TRDRNA2_171010_c0~~gnl/TRDRNA2_/TRDRNA2_171010_c0_seq2.p1  ORF type:complete len:290 (-),score=61.85 gnl/TRDRNA2_/TRDRNA2_171010_c0_seq2:269-1138(-)
MSGPTLTEPLIQEGARSGRVKVVAFAFLLLGSGFVVLLSQGPSADMDADQSQELLTKVALGQQMRGPARMPTHQAAQPSWGFRSLQRAPRYIYMQVMNAVFPGTEVEIDAAGVSFPIKAVCELGEAGKACDGSTTDTGVCGTVEFTQLDAETIEIEYKVSGLKPGLHGFHIHEKADFSNGCASAGPHYNPFGKTHGGPDDLERHVGDMGNMEAGADGTASGKITDKMIKLFGDYTVAGRSIMVHADPDDLGKGPLEGWPEVPPPPAPAQHTKTTGNAGARIGCGIIKLS